MSKTDCLDKIPIDLVEPIPSIHGEAQYTIMVPCGKCARCIMRRKMEWSFRINEEMKMSKTAYFVTLTYSPEYVPYCTTHRVKGKRVVKKQYWKKTLDPYDLELFLKRLRKRHKKNDVTLDHYIHNLRSTDKISFYACGEYGELRQRPHYHLILFNTCEMHIQQAWTMGEVHIVKANKNTISYVMKYLDKRLGQKKDPHRHPEFNTMSEGIGLEYIRKNGNWHRQNIDVLYVSNESGIKVPMPKYYRLKLFDEATRREQMILVNTRLEEIKTEFIDQFGEMKFHEHKAKDRRNGEIMFKLKTKKRKID